MFWDTRTHVRIHRLADSHEVAKFGLWHRSKIFVQKPLTKSNPSTSVRFWFNYWHSERQTGRQFSSCRFFSQLYEDLQFWCTIQYTKLHPSRSLRFCVIVVARKHTDSLLIHVFGPNLTHILVERWPNFIFWRSFWCYSVSKRHI